jgi:hypothetical protein
MPKVTPLFDEATMLSLEADRADAALDRLDHEIQFFLDARSEPLSHVPAVGVDLRASLGQPAAQLL